MSFGFKIMAEGDYACFTRPEMKVERVSYDWPTPSALEGMLKSIYWKPAIRYVIDKIVVFNKIEFANIRRNEVKEKMTLSIKALLPEEPKAEVNEENETKGKGRQRNTKKEETVDPDELHEWKDNEVGGASIADLLNSDK